MDVRVVIEVFRANADSATAAGMGAYMRDQFPFLGLPRPRRTALAREFLAAPRDSVQTMADAIELYAQPEREFQYLTADLLDRHRRVLTGTDIDTAIGLLDDRPWWDSVDALRKPIALWTKAHPGTLAEQLAGLSTGSMWCRRVAITLQLQWKADTDRELLTATIAANLDDPEFFIQKAIGWALRDYGRTDPVWVQGTVESLGVSGLARREALKHIGSGE